ncbi:MAG TPA: DUF2752 domain-containing protein [Methylomirabilota bacterium]|nr:DUF2752 domain-containing protein [Methylomirabilota bacterium]
MAAALLYIFNPADHGFYPRCYLKVMTGLDCPGCGGLRATHQLLHGHIAEAFALNPLFVVAVPIGGLVALLMLAESLTGRKWPRIISMTATIWICATVTVAFAVLRNIPWRAWLGL